VHWIYKHLQDLHEIFARKPHRHKEKQTDTQKQTELGGGGGFLGTCFGSIVMA
jgi:hypothetical protein